MITITWLLYWTVLGASTAFAILYCLLVWTLIRLGDLQQKVQEMDVDVKDAHAFMVSEFVGLGAVSLADGSGE